MKLVIMQSGEFLGAERRAAHYFSVAWKLGCSVPAIDIIICTEYWQDLYRQLYTLVLYTIVSYMYISAGILIMCSV